MMQTMQHEMHLAYEHRRTGWIPMKEPPMQRILNDGPEENTNDNV